MPRTKELHYLSRGVQGKVYGVLCRFFEKEPTILSHHPGACTNNYLILTNFCTLLILRFSRFGKDRDN